MWFELDQPFMIKKIKEKLKNNVFLAGVLGVCGNLWVIIVISSSAQMRKKLINILFTSQSFLDLLCGLLLILTCKDKIFVPEGGYFGIKGWRSFLYLHSGLFFSACFAALQISHESDASSQSKKAKLFSQDLTKASFAITHYMCFMDLMFI